MKLAPSSVDPGLINLADYPPTRMEADISFLDDWGHYFGGFWGVSKSENVVVSFKPTT